MKVWQLSEREIYRAAANADVRIYNMRDDGNAKRFTLKLADSKKWQRLSASGFNRERKVNAVCWHGHYHFMREVFRINENARIKTSWQDYRGLESFLQDAPMTGFRNVGSLMFPAQAREVCLCADRGDDYIMPETVCGQAHAYTMRQADIAACPHYIIDPQHYRSDGSCRCDDPAERERLIRECDYTADDFRRAS